jgi:hypothetical protein
MSEAETTTDRKQIRKWAEERDARPASVDGTGNKGEAGILSPGFWTEGRQTGRDLVG